MNEAVKLGSHVRPCWRRSGVSLVLLTAIVMLDLTIPRLIQRLIEQGIAAGDQPVVLQTSLWMLGICWPGTLSYSLVAGILVQPPAHHRHKDILEGRLPFLQRQQPGLLLAQRADDWGQHILGLEDEA